MLIGDVHPDVGLLVGLLAFAFQLLLGTVQLVLHCRTRQLLGRKMRQAEEDRRQDLLDLMAEADDRLSKKVLEEQRGLLEKVTQILDASRDARVHFEAGWDKSTREFLRRGYKFPSSPVASSEDVAKRDRLLREALAELDELELQATGFGRASSSSSVGESPCHFETTAEVEPTRSASADSGGDDNRRWAALILGSSGLGNDNYDAEVALAPF